MKREIEIGDEIKFITKDGYIPEYYIPLYDETIPHGITQHGRTVFKRNKGIILAIVGKYYLIEYIDHLNDAVRLCFLPDSFKVIKPSGSLRIIIKQIRKEIATNNKIT